MRRFLPDLPLLLAGPAGWLVAAGVDQDSPLLIGLGSALGTLALLPLIVRFMDPSLTRRIK